MSLAGRPDREGQGCRQRVCRFGGPYGYHPIQSHSDHQPVVAEGSVTDLIAMEQRRCDSAARCRIPQNCDVVFAASNGTGAIVVEPGTVDTVAMRASRTCCETINCDSRFPELETQDMLGA